jgi:Uma2 family endonuclease
MAIVASAIPEVVYPSSDGEPMAETPLHRDVMLNSIATLGAYFADEADVYVSGNMMMYYVEGNAEKWISPDVFLTRGIPKLPEREIYQVWREGKGPDAVIEITSPSTVRFDTRRKLELYRDVLKVAEYFLFDPRDRSLAGTALCGFRLIDDQYELISGTAGRLKSDVIGLHLEATGEELRFYDPQQAIYLPTPAEIREALKHETAARIAAQAEVEQLRAEIEALRRAVPPNA